MTTRRLKRLAAATAAAGLVTGLLPSAAGAVKKQTVAPVVMGAENLIAGSSGKISVTIPRDAAFDAKTGDNPYFRFSGGGRFAGVLLAETGPDLISSGVSFFAGRYGFCGSPGCTPRETTQFLTVSGTDGEPALPAGNYDLYLIAETRASVRLQFDGLSGTTKIVPQRAIDTQVTEPGSGVAIPQNVAYSYGQSYDFKGEYGFVFDVLSITGDAWALGRYGNCIWRGDPPVPPEVAYSAPGCPGGLTLHQVDFTTRVSEFRIDSYSTTLFDPGKWAMSSFYEAGGLIDGSNALSVAADLPPN
ncbi:MAG TPA: hypothetical protein VG318_17140 [Actinomycetota bacterium]|nr:hypothetical protein [Actinomycetota bacterium]